MHNINNIRRNADRKNKKMTEDIKTETEIDDKTKEDMINIDLSRDIKELGLSGIVSGNLKRAGVKNLRDLLKLDYCNLKYIHGIESKGKNEILNFVHTLGYTIQNEPDTLSYQEKKEQGQALLEDYGIPRSVCLPLYRASIYTMKALKEDPDAVERVKYFGPKKKEILQLYLDQPESISQKENLSQPTKNTMLKLENEEIKKRIETKQQLLDEYDRLVTERETLMKKERELDEKIDKIRGEIFAQPKQYTKQPK